MKTCYPIILISLLLLLSCGNCEEAFIDCFDYLNTELISESEGLHFQTKYFSVDASEMCSMDLTSGRAQFNFDANLSIYYQEYDIIGNLQDPRNHIVNGQTLRWESFTG
eukprot:CAMPEP_0170556294 /NCGR_PEP_ID=MMETSP0211-20121228/16148_1 /TAXON_ID=311385 /ORGANISM="Pseudokeronopsis sp., Strain OXSARD2" /LENGTH=108 /DNA_ID=CAMNT_0010866543 /DNA_START=1 /DNA_END=327 /DNA_ORIENTATION=+